MGAVAISRFSIAGFSKLTLCSPPWRNPRKGRDQILPSGNLVTTGSADVAVHYAGLLDAGAGKARAAAGAGGGGNPRIGATFENALATPLGNSTG